MLLLPFFVLCLLVPLTLSDFLFRDFGPDSDFWETFEKDSGTTHGSDSEGWESITEAANVILNEPPDGSRLLLKLHWRDGCPGVSCLSTNYSSGAIRTVRDNYGYGYFGVVATPPISQSGGWPVQTNTVSQFDVTSSSQYLLLQNWNARPRDLFLRSDSGTYWWDMYSMPASFGTYCEGLFGITDGDPFRGDVEIGILIRPNPDSEQGGDCIELYYYDYAVSGTFALLDRQCSFDEAGIPEVFSVNGYRIRVWARHALRPPYENVPQDADGMVASIKHVRFVEGVLESFPEIIDPASSSPSWYYYLGGGLGVVLLLFIIVIIVLLVGVYFCCIVPKKKQQRLQFDVALEETDRLDAEKFATLEINKDLFIVSYDELELKSVIGTGGSESTIYRATWRNKVVAFKVFRTSTVFPNQRCYDEFEKEAAVLSGLSHPNVIQFFGASLKPPRVGIVMEYCSHGDIPTFFASRRGKVRMTTRLRFLRDIVNAMDYLHSRSVWHRDCKPQNCLVARDLTIKLIDFGLARFIREHSEALTTRIGTSEYMAPEMVRNEKYDGKVDVFAFGIITHCILHGNFRPYGSRTVETMVSLKVANDDLFRPRIQKNRGFPAWLVEQMELCWDGDPFRRPAFSDLKRLFESKASST